jgi:hypothetical protein
MSIDAMKQALEALDGELPGWRTPAQERAITALRTAIEQAEKQKPRGYFTINDYDMLEQVTGTQGTPLYEATHPCPTCEALARTVMMDQTGRDA